MTDTTKRWYAYHADDDAYLGGPYTIPAGYKKYDYINLGDLGYIYLAPEGPPESPRISQEILDEYFADKAVEMQKKHARAVQRRIKQYLKLKEEFESLPNLRVLDITKDPLPDERFEVNLDEDCGSIPLPKTT